MRGIIDQIHSPTFWFGALVGGLVMGVLAYYVTRAIDRAVGGFTARRRAAIARREQERDKEIDELAERIGESDRDWARASTRSRYHGLASTIYLATSLAIVTISGAVIMAMLYEPLVALGIALVGAGTALRAARHEQDERRVILDAMTRVHDIEKSADGGNGR